MTRPRAEASHASSIQLGRQSLLFVSALAASGAKEKRLPGLDGPPPAPLVAEKADPKVAQLIEDLGSDDYRTREKAGADLAANGEKALPTCELALLATDSPEVQRRLAVLVRKMDTTGSSRRSGSR